MRHLAKAGGSVRPGTIRFPGAYFWPGIRFKTTAAILVVVQLLLSYNTCPGTQLLQPNKCSWLLHLPGKFALAGSKSQGRLLLTRESHFRRCSKQNLTPYTCRGIFESFTATDRGFLYQKVTNHYFFAVLRIRIRIIWGLLDPDPDPHGQIRIPIQEVKSSEIKLKSEKKITRTIWKRVWRVEDWADTNNSKNSLYFLHFFIFIYMAFLYIIWKRGFFLIFSNFPSWIWFHMDIFGIPDPHKNLCRSKTLLFVSKSENSVLFCVESEKLLLFLLYIEKWQIFINLLS